MVDEAVLEDCHQLINSCKSLILATANEKASHASYAPFVQKDQNFYILVSGLAEHTNNLINSPDKMGCMLIADEGESKQIFARRRLMFKAMPIQIERESKQWEVILSQFKTRFGEIVDLLDSLPDFILFELKPEQVVLVKGFGDAHQVPDHQI